MGAISTTSQAALAALLRGTVPSAQLQLLVQFITEYASADVIDESELDCLVEQFLDDEGA